MAGNITQQRQGLVGVIMICLLLLPFWLLRPAHATVVAFFSPAGFGGTEALITFDDAGLPSNTEFREISGVGFALVESGTITDTGHGPTMASAPDSTYDREFPPRDGPFFLNTINFDALGTDLLISFPNPINRVAAEIRSGQTQNDVRDLSFELYRAGTLVGDLTIPIRGQNDFFFYGLASSDAFDRWVIRQRPDERFDLENLRYEAIPEPGTLVVLLTGLGLLLSVYRARKRVV